MAKIHSFDNDLSYSSYNLASFELNAISLTVYDDDTGDEDLAQVPTVDLTAFESLDFIEKPAYVKRAVTGVIGGLATNPVGYFYDDAAKMVFWGLNTGLTSILLLDRNFPLQDYETIQNSGATSFDRDTIELAFSSSNRALLDDAQYLTYVASKPNGFSAAGKITSSGHSTINYTASGAGIAQHRVMLVDDETRARIGVSIEGHGKDGFFVRRVNSSTPLTYAVADNINHLTHATSAVHPINNILHVFHNNFMYTWSPGAIRDDNTPNVQAIHNYYMERAWWNGNDLYFLGLPSLDSDFTTSYTSLNLYAMPSFTGTPVLLSSVNIAPGSNRHVARIPGTNAFLFSGTMCDKAWDHPTSSWVDTKNLIRDPTDTLESPFPITSVVNNYLANSCELHLTVRLNDPTILKLDNDPELTVFKIIKNQDFD